ncbi:MAG: hypothetical protein IKZ49_01120 [Alphaproteobacteria bacterium]|nr:hypothetical protein [Alphaproteobacteria bacterium]
MKIYFDMDGVLVDFDSMRPNSSNLNHPSQELSEQERELKRQFWLNIEKQDNFWANIPEIKDIKNVLDIAKSMGEIFVLSKTPGAKHFVGGQNYVNYVADEKRKWILKNLNQYFDENHIIICDGKKGELINPTKEDILVDDREENITEWESHNGRGILFVNSSDAVKKLKELN